MTNNIAKDASINCHNKNVRCKIDWYILHTVLLVIKLRTIHNRYHFLSLCKS